MELQLPHQNIVVNIKLANINKIPMGFWSYIKNKDCYREQLKLNCAHPSHHSLFIHPSNKYSWVPSMGQNLCLALVLVLFWHLLLLWPWNLPNLSILLFPSFLNWAFTSTYLIGLLWRLSELINIKDIEQCLAQANTSCICDNYSYHYK